MPLIRPFYCVLKVNNLLIVVYNLWITHFLNKWIGLEESGIGNYKMSVMRVRMMQVYDAIILDNDVRK
jgi:hypothetical protein